MSELSSSRLTTGRGLLAAAFAVLGSAAYMVIHSKPVNLAPGETTPIGLLVIFQCILSLLLCTFGVITVAGNILPIALSAILDDGLVDVDTFNPDFMVFNHRGKVMPGAQ